MQPTHDGLIAEPYEDNMNRYAITLFCALLVFRSLQLGALSAETDRTSEKNALPVPRLVHAKLTAAGLRSKLVLTFPSYRDEKFTGFKPRLHDADRFRFYDVDGKALTVEQVATLTPKMTAIFLVDRYTGNFDEIIAEVRDTASLSDGGKIAVVDATQSSGDLNSGGAIATVNSLGLDKTFPSRHSGNDSHGWLGRDDINKGFADPDRYGWLHYDLGTEQRLCGLRIWNYNYAKLLGRAVRDMDVYVSNDANAYGDNQHASWENVADLNFIEQGPGHLSQRNYRSDHVIAEPTEARYVRLDIQRNWGNGWNTALGEVQFFALPEVSIFATTPDKVEPPESN